MSCTEQSERGEPTGAGGDRRAPWELSAVEVAARVRSRELSAVAVVRSCLERAGRVEPALNAYVEIDRGGALARAEEVDRRIARGEMADRRAFPLPGVPLAIKDNLSVAGRPLTCGSRILEGYVAPFTATTVERLVAAGAVPLGRTNLDELAMGSSCETSVHGATHNPWDLDRVPGGSSGGSAAAVAAASVPLALGSDAGGSVRQPAALCGVVGLRPTWGRVSRWGLVAFASSFDQVGPIARTVEDAGLALAVMAGPDPRDATCADRPVDDLVEGLDRLDEGIGGWRVGIIRELGLSGARSDGMEIPAATRAAFGAALERLAADGAEIVEVSVPAIGSAMAAYAVLAAAEASSNLARFDGVRYGRRAEGRDAAAAMEASRSAGLGAEAQRRILLGTFALSAGYAERFYGRAQRVRRRLTAELEAAFDRVDVVATPTASAGAFALGARLGDPVAMARSDVLTTPAALAGLPAVSVPCGLDPEGLPLGLQLIAPAFAEGRLLRAGRAAERGVGLERPRLGAAEGSA